MTQNGVSGDTVDIDKGTAWNNAYINQIETTYFGIKVTKLSMSTVSTQCRETATKGITRATGFQAPRIVKLFASSAGPSGSFRQNLKELCRDPNGGALRHTAISRIQRQIYKR